MAFRNIVKRGDSALTKKCRTVEDFGIKTAQLLDDMAQTMYKAEGVGLAAPQVGILKRMVVVDIGEGLIELINPEIIERSGEQEGIEGCLSCPGIWALTTRPQTVTVRAQDRYGEVFEITATDFLARAFCHEIDHLDGITIYESATRMLSAEEIKQLQKEN